MTGVRGGAGRRRFALYFSWSRPAEAGAELGVLDNRYPTLFEFRRAIWPFYEWAADAGKYDQGIGGFCEHVVLFDFQRFDAVVTEATGRAVSLLQRLDDEPPVREIDDDLLREVDTLVVVSLDHLVTGQRASEAETDAVRAFLQREEACLVVCPHHDVGETSDPAVREIEHRHHGDVLVPGQQRIGGFARSLLDGLGLSVTNRFALNPARDPRTGEPEPLEVRSELDELGLLRGVTTFNAHPHLPHFDIGYDSTHEARVLARQPINRRGARHPMLEAGHRYFSSLVWVPPDADRAGNVVIGDATLWSSAFGGVRSLEQFWLNLAGL